MLDTALNGARPGCPRHTAPRALRQRLDESPRQCRRPTLVVFQEDVDPPPAVDCAQPGGPVRKITGLVIATTEADVTESRGGDQRRLELFGLGAAERGAVRAQQRPGVVLEPRIVPELERGLGAGRKGREEGLEPGQVGLQVGRKLEEQGAALSLQRLAPPYELARRLGGLLQA